MSSDDDGPAQKRRRINDAGDSTPVQTIYEDFADSDDSDDDETFEDVDLGLDEPDEQADTDVSENENASLQISLEKPMGPDQPAPRVRRRLPLTKAEKKLRLDVHKAHVRFLVYHVWARNAWCNVDDLRNELKKLVLPKTRRLIRSALDGEGKSRSECNHALNTGLEEVSKMWKAGWKVTGSGMRRAWWADGAEDLRKQIEAYSAESSVTFEDFKRAAKKREGSRDLGAQLFCSLMRSLEVDTRLVCSLQVLPFSGEAKGSKPQKQLPTYARVYNIDNSPRPPPRAPPAQPRQTAFSSPLRRIGLRASNPPPAPTYRIPPPRPSGPSEIEDSPYPIFWVEVFNPILNRWIPVDPLVRSTINKPRTGFEPAASDPFNTMSYVIAFEKDFSAHDVTRRYTPHYNAKIRRNRVESTSRNGEGREWMRKLVAAYERPMPLQRYLEMDADEVGELAEHEEREEMPKNVDDFKDHPKYALERHLRRNEALAPLSRRIAIFSAGSKKTTEPVFRRGDVRLVRSSEQWYRIGRAVKAGEQPIKRVLPRKSLQQSRRSTSVDGDEQDVEAEGARLYAESQTELYVPPPIVNHNVPRNVFGNIEVFVPSMVPAGGRHIRHADAALAGRILGISFAPAVTGFAFQGRRGTAVTDGIVAAADHEEALREVIISLDEMRDEMVREQKRVIVLGLWRKMMAVLRVKERVREYEHDSEMEDEEDQDEDVDEDAILEEYKVEKDENVRRPQANDREYGGGGGFVASENEEGGAGGFMANEGENDSGGGFMASEAENESRGGFVANEVANESGGGFMAGEAEHESGGGILANQEEFESGRGFLADEAEKNGETQVMANEGEDQGANADLGAGGFMVDEKEESEQHLPSAATENADEDDDSESSRGSLPYEDPDDDSGGGGFLADDEDF
ncbi:MAG: hypothetical protein Q9160_004036 [Pyrenula sp. 1 TL-2023]